MQTEGALMQRVAIFVLAMTAFAIPAWAQFSPLIHEERVVTQVTGDNRTIEVIGGMVLVDRAPEVLATRGIRFPAGTYVLEAEDEENLYFRAPDDLEIRVFESGQTIDGRLVPGGLSLSKRWIDLTPAHGYFSDDATNKVLIWKLGSEFLREEGSSWRKNY